MTSFYASLLSSSQFNSVLSKYRSKLYEISVLLLIMLRILIGLCALAGISQSSEDVFLNFIKKFDKKYASFEEYIKRREIFMKNYDDIQRHNEEEIKCFELNSFGGPTVLKQ